VANLNLSADFKPFIDKYGLIAQKDSSGADGGDSAHRFGITYSCLKLLGYKYWVTNSHVLDDYYQTAMHMYQVSNDVYVRHPDPEKWYSNPLNFSRDQTVMLIKAMLMRGDFGRVKRLFGKIFKNLGRYPNVYPNYAVPGEERYKKKFPDILTPSGVADFIRSFNNRCFYPLLCVLDCVRFVDVFLAEREDNECKTRGKRTDYFVMLATDIAVSRYVQDTFVMRAVARRLAKTDYKTSIEWIFGPQFDDPAIHKLLILVCERYIDSCLK